MFEEHGISLCNSKKYKISSVETISQKKLKFDYLIKITRWIIQLFLYYIRDYIKFNSNFIMFNHSFLKYLDYNK